MRGRVLCWVIRGDAGLGTVLSWRWLGLPCVCDTAAQPSHTTDGQDIHKAPKSTCSQGGTRGSQSRAVAGPAPPAEPSHRCRGLLGAHLRQPQRDPQGAKRKLRAQLRPALPQPVSVQLGMGHRESAAHTAAAAPGLGALLAPGIIEAQRGRSCCPALIPSGSGSRPLPTAARPG